MEGLIRLDLGCGKNKAKGPDGQPYIGVDAISFEGVDVVHDLRCAPWPWEDNSIDEVFSSHFLEHLPGSDRIVFFNELHRVLKPGGKALIITPYWSHDCAYGDPTHAWPPISTWYVLYLNQAWRGVNAPHVGYTCDFDWTTGFGMDEWLLSRNDEVRAFAMQHYTNSVRDLHATVTKRSA